MKRKYNYIFFNNGIKERILHWFKTETYYKINEFILYTKDRVYWYRECDREDRFNEIYQPSHPFIIKRTLLYQLKDGVHKLDFNDESLWHSVENFDRFEIMVFEND
jgi:hypothetical protein